VAFVEPELVVAVVLELHPLVAVAQAVAVQQVLDLA
jgi:hypothetical protein